MVRDLGVEEPFLDFLNVWRVSVLAISLANVRELVVSGMSAFARILVDC
jgi:hypothetical protein